MMTALAVREGSPHSCPVCGQPMVARLESWLVYCRACEFWGVLQEGAELRLREESRVVEAQRHAGLVAVRERNNAVILDAVERVMPLKGATLLDVGCSYGWFLTAAAGRGAVSLGIEPEEEVARAALRQGCRVRMGYFPACVDPAERFDVIVFNDVLEHLPDVGQVLESCHALLATKGVLVVNLPVSSGIVFRLARRLASLGCRWPWCRLWQRGYRSPHLSYFNAANLTALAAGRGFRLLHAQRLQTVTIAGLWPRLTMERDRPLWTVLASCLAVLLAYPVLSWLAPPDLMLFLFERADRPAGAESTT